MRLIPVSVAGFDRPAPNTLILVHSQCSHCLRGDAIGKSSVASQDGFGFLQ